MANVGSIVAEINEARNQFETIGITDNFLQQAYNYAQQRLGRDPNLGEAVFHIIGLIHNSVVSCIQQKQTSLVSANLTSAQWQQLQKICKKANNIQKTVVAGAAGAIAGNWLIGGWLGLIGGAAIGAYLGSESNKKDRGRFNSIVIEAIDFYCACLVDANNRVFSNQLQETKIPKQIKKNNSEVPPKETENNEINKNNGNNKKKPTYPLLKDVIGLDDAKECIKEKVIKPIKNPEIYRKYNMPVGGGLLLYGLPGTGKTMFAQALANELDAYFISLKASDIRSKWMGESEQNIKKYFDEAREHKVSIMFIDEFEAIGAKRDNNMHSGSYDPVNELLAQMQGFEKKEGSILYIVAATNRPWAIDSALLRPGRFETKVRVDLPNQECRKLMFINKLKMISIPDNIISYLANKTDGYNGADIENVCSSIKRIMIDNELSKKSKFKFNKEVVNRVLAKCRSSVQKNDIFQLTDWENENL